MKFVTVFGTRHSKPGHVEYESARRLGKMIAKAVFGVISGGYGGAMEAASRGAHEVGGHTRGITTSILDAFRTHCMIAAPTFDLVTLVDSAANAMSVLRQRIVAT